MFAKQMIFDYWGGIADHGTTVVSPTWDQVRQAIDDLDGERRTMVTLSERPSSGVWLIVAGHCDERFLVTASTGADRHFTLVDAVAGRDMRVMFVGGQDGEYEAAKLVPRAWAVEAAQAFFETGELKHSMSWQEDA